MEGWTWSSSWFPFPVFSSIPGPWSVYQRRGSSASWQVPPSQRPECELCGAPPVSAWGITTSQAPRFPQGWPTMPACLGLSFPGFSLESLCLRETSSQKSGLVIWCSSWVLLHFSTFSLASRRPWCWERVKVGGEGDDRGGDGWIASLTQWTWVWVSSGSWWWAWKPAVLQSMGLQRVGHEWAIEPNWAVVSAS